MAGRKTRFAAHALGNVLESAIRSFPNALSPSPLYLQFIGLAVKNNPAPYFIGSSILAAGAACLVRRQAALRHHETLGFQDIETAKLSCEKTAILN